MSENAATSEDEPTSLLRVTCPATPLQIEGPIDGGYIYFRARHGHWQIGVGREQNAAVQSAFRGREPAGFRGEDEDEGLSFGDLARARALIAEYLPRLAFAEADPPTSRRCPACSPQHDGDLT